MNIYRDSKELETIIYPDGAVQVRIRPEYLKDFNSENTFNIWWKADGTLDGLMWVGLAADAIRRYKEFPITMNLVVPYLPYARADRRFVTGDCFGLKVMGEIINSFFFDHVVAVDVHNYKVAKRAINNLINVPVEDVIEDIIWDWKNVTILMPDEGAKNRYNFSGIWNVKCCSKIRDPKTGELSGFNVPSGLKGTVLIVDDLCDGGGTFLGIYSEIAKGKTLPDNIYLYTTHGIYSKGIDNLRGWFNRVYCTDSYVYGEKPNEDRVIKLEPYINKVLEKL